jgi:hypothetical protein
MLDHQKWILFDRRLHPPVYDSVLRCAEIQNVVPKGIGHVTAPEEAFPFVADGSAIAFVVKAGALRLARNGVTVRPLSDEALLLNTYFISRSDNETRVASELVRAFMRKVLDVGKDMQLKLPITA